MGSAQPVVAQLNAIEHLRSFLARAIISCCVCQGGAHASQGYCPSGGSSSLLNSGYTPIAGRGVIGQPTIPVLQVRYLILSCFIIFWGQTPLIPH